MSGGVEVAWVACVYWMADIERRAKSDQEVSRRQRIVVLLKEAGLRCRRVGDVSREQIFGRTLADPRG
jgi:hypothetical protein